MLNIETMIINTMIVREEMLSLLKEFKEEIVPLYTNAWKELERLFQNSETCLMYWIDNDITFHNFAYDISRKRK